MMSKILSIFFFALAGLLVVSVIIPFIPNHFIASDAIFSLILPGAIRASFEGFEAFILLPLSLILIFFGYYFSHSNIHSAGLFAQGTPAKIKGPVYMMVLGLWLPLIDLFFGPHEGFGALIVWGFSFLAGAILVVLGVILYFWL